ncbi:hypothetical protein Vi05172_g6779 [Venturia inaequalis]|nr:hypothetical protein Vi05172_g6779 [Venturia inaequalis]
MVRKLLELVSIQALGKESRKNADATRPLQSNGKRLHPPSIHHPPTIDPSTIGPSTIDPSTTALLSTIHHPPSTTHHPLPTNPREPTGPTGPTPSTHDTTIVHPELESFNTRSRIDSSKLPRLGKAMLQSAESTIGNRQSTIDRITGRIC